MQTQTFRGKTFYRAADIIAKRGKDLKHEIQLLKRRLKHQAPIVRSLPDFAHQALIEAQGPLLTFNEDGDFSSRGLTDWYVQQFCRANHLKEC